MSLYQKNTAIKLEARVPILHTVPKAKELFDEEQKNVNKITEKLANEYFDAINFSVLPF